MLKTKNSDEHEEQTVTVQISNWNLRKNPENRYCSDQGNRASVFWKTWDTRQHKHSLFCLENLGAES